MIGKDGPGSGHGDGLRIQFYWPRIKIRKGELFIGAPTQLRIVKRPGYFGFGANILGFGMGIDYQKTPKEDLTK